MDVARWYNAIEATGLATWLRVSNEYAIPVINCVHVLALGMVFGSIIIVDLRMLGVASVNRPYSVVANDYLRWTWVSFIVAAISGGLMSIANASIIYANTQFQLKMLAILIAGLNMAVFHLVTAKSVPQWDKNPRPPTLVRLTGALSLLLWFSVIVLGRWIGYTKSLHVEIP
ncbi:MAG: DUF6644 family protein, partial [Steroidobacteraceae bacterium]